MKQKINNILTNYYTNFFPITRTFKNGYKYTYTIGIGGNIGNTKHIFHKLFLAINTNSNYNIVQTSPILKNPPFGYLEQNDFFNAIIVIQSNKSSYEILKLMQRYEFRFKRKRTFQDAPRTLDIDIIFAKKGITLLQSKDPKLLLPHPGYKERESVLYPLMFINKIYI